MNVARRQAVDSPRSIRSYVLRQGRITGAQQAAFTGLMPRYGLDPTQGRLDLAAIFGRDARRTLEIGFGNGGSLLTLATRHPDEDFIGVEVHRPGIGRLLMDIESQKLANLRVICSDAVEVLEHCLPDASLDAVLVYFPDPWPKKRHHKRRLVQAEFVAQIALKLKRGGRLQLATDWPDYAEHMLTTLSADPDLVNAQGAGYASRSPDRPLTRFESRGLRLGHSVHDLVFVKR